MKRVLIVQTAYLGDVVLSQPLWAAVKTYWPEAQVDVLVQPQWASLIEQDAALAEVLVFDKRKHDKGLAGLLRLSRDLRRRHYDLALCPHPSFRSALLLAMARIPHRVGFADSAGRFFFTDRVHRDTSQHEVDRVLSLTTALGWRVPNEQRTPRLVINPEAAGRLASWGLPEDGRYVCVHPGSVWATKRWLPEGFAAVLSALADDGYTPVVLGGRDDIELANIVQDHCRTLPVNLAGRLSLTELTAVLSRAALLVTNDSGPMHIAGAVGTPVAAVFGSTTPELGYAPVGSPSRILQRHLPCRPCGPHGYRSCPLDHFHCMRHVTEAEVTAAARELLTAE
ncbi:MAG: lipopolysaccharide heptosyltransferase II [Candidatus Lernaella stagnicola]|nr:lipopolysaccharide heptosyltransferase II [Candidatus Lernaella stagnicola]